MSRSTRQRTHRVTRLNHTSYQEMDAIHCYITELDDLFALLKSPSLNQASRTAIEAQCSETLHVMTTACMELQLGLLAEARSAAAAPKQRATPAPIIARPQKKIEIDTKGDVSRTRTP